LADERLERVKEEAKLERSELDALGDNVVVEEVTEEVAERKRADTRAN